MFPFHRLQASDAGADTDSDPIGIFLPHLNTRILQRLTGRRHSKLAECLHPAGCLAIHVFFRIKVLYFCRQLYLIIRCIKFCNRTDPDFSFFAGFPELFRRISDRRYRSKTCDHHASSHVSDLRSNIFLHEHAAIDMQCLSRHIPALL